MHVLVKGERGGGGASERFRAAMIPGKRTKPVSKYTLISRRANNQAPKPVICTGERACSDVRNYHLAAEREREKLVFQEIRNPCPCL